MKKREIKRLALTKTIWSLIADSRLCMIWLNNTMVICNALYIKLLYWLPLVSIFRATCKCTPSSDNSLKTAHMMMWCD